MRFDLTDLRLCLDVQETGTITAAAARSHMTLAAASERIRGMEDALGVPLMTRKRRGVELTPAGRTLAHHARTVLLQMDRLRGDLEQYGHGLRGHVRLQCNTSALSEYLPESLAAFLAGHRAISIDLEERVSRDIADSLRAGLCDIGVLADSADLHGLQVHPFRPDPLTLIVPRDHELAQRGRVSLSEVAHLDFVGLAEGSALQAHVAGHARRAGKPLAYRIRLRSLEAVCRMVGQGIGIGVVPRAAALRHARGAGIRRVALTDPWARRTLVLAVRDAAELPGYVVELMRHILAGAAPP
ncbi:LysR substrate-binding domain-containing protein [Bordetella genomosp. 13]|uniref:LysR family transcriptional regulator n=1 Tax=Bordetella genomosp. 13 TaxID=463040 RepID=A0A1W6ZAH9_9BORD|nr:LysR substrate-binding domain-containing protein [Bordetella genomosp. 13]ARP94393.1 LysR family transcriptional regulator [Bordetella genomosp. 13]